MHAVIIVSESNPFFLIYLFSSLLFNAVPRNDDQWWWWKWLRLGFLCVEMSLLGECGIEIIIESTCSNEDCFLDDESIENYVPLRGVVSRCRFNQERGICLRNYDTQYTKTLCIVCVRVCCYHRQSSRIPSFLNPFSLSFRASYSSQKSL